jgi:4-diphosphocytidyl-2-C-methyl-D-erythritol kinase
MNMLTLQAPAKLNLTLEVLGKRRDGFHEICSVIQTIGLCDSLHFQAAQNMEFKSDAPGWVSGESLVSKASSLLKEVTGCTKGVTITVDKRIPWLSGLGGDSSDAATTLRGLNQLWELGLSLKRLLELAAQLGSDVPFFLYGGTALATGRGEIVTQLPSLPHKWVVLMVPSLPRVLGKTGQLYASLKTSDYSRGQITDRLVILLKRHRKVKLAGLFNVFDAVTPDNLAGLDNYREQILKAGAREIQLAGSGPALFTLVEDKNWAEKIYQNLQEKGLESYLSHTFPTIEQIK